MPLEWEYRPTGPDTRINNANKAVRSYLDTIGMPGGFGGLFGKGGGATNFGPGFQGLPDLDRPTRPTVERPSIGEFGQPSREGIGLSLKDLRARRAGYERPTETGAFQNLMNLASTRTAAAADATGAEGRRAAQRRGYSGGFGDLEEQTGRDRMKALASTGFEGAAQIRKEEGEMYRANLESYNTMSRGYNDQIAARNAQYAESLQRARLAQTEADTGYNASMSEYNKALLDKSRIPAEYIRSFSDLLGGFGGSGIFESALGLEKTGQVFKQLPGASGGGGPLR